MKTLRRIGIGQSADGPTSLYVTANKPELFAAGIAVLAAFACSAALLLHGLTGGFRKG